MNHKNEMILSRGRLALHNFAVLIFFHFKKFSKMGTLILLGIVFWASMVWAYTVYEKATGQDRKDNFKN